MILTLPAVAPVTMPEELPTVAFPLLAVHVPPPILLLNVVDAPTHTLFWPVFADGVWFTVTIVVEIQPPVNR